LLGIAARVSTVQPKMDSGQVLQSLNMERVSMLAAAGLLLAIVVLNQLDLPRTLQISRRCVQRVCASAVRWSLSE
jgi:hypothetical protein